MAKKPKETASMSKIAKTYRKAHKTSNPTWDGATYVDAKLNKKGIGSTGSEMTYKPKARQVVMGGTRKGKPATIRKRGTV